MVTIAIIGVVAVVTIPSIQRKIVQENAVNNLKKAYIVSNIALKQIFRENKDPRFWSGNNTAKTQKLAELFRDKLRYIMYCPYGGEKCYPCKNSAKIRAYQVLNGGTAKSNYWLTMNNGSMVNYNGIVAADGMIYRISYSPNYTKANTAPLKLADYGWLGEITVDINGKKGPNRAGYDYFMFHYDENGIKDGPKSWVATHPAQCSTITPYKDHTDGYTCSYWVIKYGNLDYLKRNVSSEW